MNKILAVKLKNALIKTKDSDKLDIQLKNIIINGNKTGCSGFIINKENNSCVYVNTEYTPLLYRYAENNKDYRGRTNCFCDTIDELVYNITHMLEHVPVKRA